jgi:hypothetical protein
MKKLVLTALALLIAAPAFAQESAMSEKLGDAYTKASPQDKLVQIAVAIADKKMDHKDRKAYNLAIDEIYVAEVNKGKSSKEKLELLGAMRKAVDTKTKALNKERRAVNKKAGYLRFMEPETALQTALAMSYVLDTAGPSPTIEALSCLKLVRDNTSWFGNGDLVHAYVADALARDEGYSKADHAGKLAIISKLADQKKALGSQEQKYLDKAVLVDWINTQLKAGKSIGDVLLGVKDLKKKGLICWFTSNWADATLTRLGNIR